MPVVRIKISADNEAPASLYSGELGFSYLSGKLFIGEYAGPLAPAGPVVELLNIKSNEKYISQAITDGETERAPSSDVIYDTLQTYQTKISIKYNSGANIVQDFNTLWFDSNLDVIQNLNEIKIAAKPYWGNIIINDSEVLSPTSYDELKIDSGPGIKIEINQNKLRFEANIEDTDIGPDVLWSSTKISEVIGLNNQNLLLSNNSFLGINEFLNVDILNSSINSKQVVNVGSVKTYVGEVASQIIDGFSLTRYIFDSPSTTWTIIHNRNSRLFQKTILDDDENEMLAPIDIIDDNSFNVLLTESMTGSVILRF